jgi:NAD(P)-dependent dehydrogenase (short-subunit alcohol dehydrogenase family)
MPKLLSTAAQPNSDVRIIVMSSIAHKQFALNEGIIFSGVTSDMRNHKGVQLYGQANLAKTLFARSLAKRYPQLTISSLHPGTVWTAVWTGEKSISSLLATVVMYAARLTGVSPAEGSKNQLWCSVSKNVKNGAYYEPIGKESPGKLSYDDVLGERLWEWTSKELQKHGAPGWPSSPRAD